MQNLGERTIVGGVIGSGLDGFSEGGNGALGVPLQRKHLSYPVVTDVLIRMWPQRFPESIQSRFQSPLLQQFHAFLVEALTPCNLFIQSAGPLLQLPITIEGLAGLSDGTGSPVRTAQKIVCLWSQLVEFDSRFQVPESGADPVSLQVEGSHLQMEIEVSQSQGLSPLQGPATLFKGGSSPDYSKSRAPDVRGPVRG